ncbi:MFS transporter [Bacillaceae bacterium CLA-AA-H227]|uniref:MFS transporter n=1 Tax=Robertmurraya yapensis (ex Hitch et al 2024) TaxID=3133160 RepID=A0ACC6S6P4_9BACI
MYMRYWDYNLNVRLIGEAMFNLLYWMYFPFIALYFSMELGNHVAGLLMTVPPIISMLGSLIGGSLADSLGRRPMMLVGSTLQAMMFIAFAMSWSPWLDYLAFIGIGLGGAMYRPPSAAMVADLIPESERRQVFATFTTAKNIGAVLGPALGAIFFFQYRSELLWTCAIVLLAYTFAIFFIVRETKPDSVHEKASIGTIIIQQWKDYHIILRDKIFAIYLLAGVFFVVTVMQLDLYLPVYFVEHVPSQTLIHWNDWSFNLTGTEAFGWILGLNGLLFVLFVLPVTKWLKNWKERDVFILSSFISGIGMLALGFHTNIWYLFIVTIIFTFGELMRSPVMESFVSHYAPHDARGKYIGADNLQYTIGRFLAPITVFLSEWVEPMGILGLLFIFSLISVFLYSWLFKMYEAIDN